MSEPPQTFKINLGWLGAALFVGGVVGFYYELLDNGAYHGVLLHYIFNTDNLKFWDPDNNLKWFLYKILHTNLFTDIKYSFYQNHAPLILLIVLGIVLMIEGGRSGEFRKK